MWGRSRKSPRSVTLAYSPLSRKGKTRCGSRQRPPRRGKRKSLLRPMLRRKPTTSNADELDAVPASAEGTPLHWTPFLSVGSKREDLQSMLEIFLGRSIDSRKFDLWSNCFFSLAHSTGRHEWFARTSWHARTTHNRPARPMHAAVPDREFIILTRPKRNPPPHVCGVNRLVGAV